MGSPLSSKYIGYFGRNLKVRICGLIEKGWALTSLNFIPALYLTYYATLGKLFSLFVSWFHYFKNGDKMNENVFKIEIIIYLPHRVLVTIYLLYVKYLEHCCHIYSQFSSIIF